MVKKLGQGSRRGGTHEMCQPRCRAAAGVRYELGGARKQTNSFLLQEMCPACFVLWHKMQLCPVLSCALAQNGDVSCPFSALTSARLKEKQTHAHAAQPLQPHQSNMTPHRALMHNTAGTDSRCNFLVTMCANDTSLH
eukprot:676193-Pelagomonas_calceolata.AAC.4